MLKGLGAGALLTGGGAVAWSTLDPLAGGSEDAGDAAAALSLVPLDDVTHTATGAAGTTPAPGRTASQAPAPASTFPRTRR
jgi:hypothetical protein